MYLDNNLEQSHGAYIAHKKAIFFMITIINLPNDFQLAAR